MDELKMKNVTMISKVLLQQLITEEVILDVNNLQWLGNWNFNSKALMYATRTVSSTTASPMEQNHPQHHLKNH